MSIHSLFQAVNERTTQEAFELLVAHGHAHASDDPAMAVFAFYEMYSSEGGC